MPNSLRLFRLIGGFGLVLSNSPLACSVKSRNNPPWHLSPVVQPILPVFRKAHGIITPLPVQEQNCEVDDMEIRQRTAESSWQTPGESDHQVAKIIHVAGKAPPARG